MYQYNVDLYLDGDWLDKTADVRQKPPIKITGGAKDEAASISPSRCTFTLNNSTGDYNPRNPMGQYHGDLGKNTPVRVRVPLFADTVPETDTDGWGTSWDNGPSAGGTVAASDWTRTGTTSTHAVPAANAYRRSLLKAQHVYQDACVRGSVFIDGDMSSPFGTGNITGGAIWTEVDLRYTDSSNYIGVQFIIGIDESLSVQVVDVIGGSPRILQGVTAIPGVSLTTATTFNFATLVEGQVVRAKIWGDNQAEPKDWQTVCTRATVRYGRVGIVSTLASGNTNTKPFGFRYSNLAVEARPFVGEISEFAASVADQSHAAPTVAISASGITQRTSQGSEPLDSAMTRYWSSDRRWIRSGGAIANLDAPDNRTFRTTDSDASDIAPIGGFFRITRASSGESIPVTGATFFKAVEDQLFTITNKVSAGGNTTISFVPDLIEPVKSGDSMTTYEYGSADNTPLAYWPCEDGKGSSQIGSGLVGGQPMIPVVSTPKYAESNTFPGSGPILKLNNAELNGAVNDYANTAQAFTFHCLFHHPAANDAGHGQAFVQLWTDSPVAEVWVISFSNSGADLTMDIQALDLGGAGTLFFHSYGIPLLRDAPAMLVLSVQQTGPTTVQYQLEYVRYGNDGGVAELVVYAATTATGVTSLGKLRKFQINPGGGYVDLAVGHIAAMPGKVPHFNLRDAPGGNIGEAPVRRLNRLSYEEEVPMVYCEGPLTTSFMGPQRQDTLLKNWQEVEDFDMGRFYESRGAYSFEYRARSSLYNQGYFLDLDYSTGCVLDIDTKDDDQGTRNDITVKQINGSSYRAVDETSPLSVLPPGEGGVGRYTEAPEVSALNASQLPGLANWRLALGTVDEERYPAITIKPSGDVTLAQLLSCGVGNRFRLTDLQARGTYEPIDQLVSGYTLVLDQYVPTLTINGVPSSRYNIAQIDDAARLDSDTSTLNEFVDISETAIDVFTTGGTLWTTSAGEFPFDIIVGGERMTVTNITGASSSQTFTVTRSVNGVAKTHSSGTQVSLADPVYLAL